MDIARLVIHRDKAGVPISQRLYGLFFEDINHSADGGLYAELVRNRSFEDSLPPEGCTVADGKLRNPAGWEDAWPEPEGIPGWTPVLEGAAQGSVALDYDMRLNETNPVALRLEATRTEGGRMGIMNEGFWGLSVVEKATYGFSCFAKVAAGHGALNVSLEGADGELYASGSITSIGGEWRQFGLLLASTATDPKARLEITVTEQGTYCLDVVSLFPQATYNSRENGLRSDLAAMLADLAPGFLRFPGGCIVEGISRGTAFDWKRTIGSIEERGSNYNLWGYRATNGLGFHEYLQLAEDLGAEPMFVFNCGMMCQGRGSELVPEEELDSYIQDVMDALEYANGPAESKWGALRAKAGHPEPFGLKLLEIGNENSGPAYNARYKRFYDALKAKYPDLELIANVPVPEAPMEIVDEHFYSTPQFFMQQADRYNTYDRSGPKIYVGEYAMVTGAGLGNHLAALSEAGFMTGFENNGDIVDMASYAPLFVNMDNRKWNPDLICFNSHQVYGTPSYWAQWLFARNLPTETVPFELKCDTELSRPVPAGGIGFTSWGTSVEYKDVVVTTSDGQVLYQSGPESNLEGWSIGGGNWQVEEGVFRQTGFGLDGRIWLPHNDWEDYTLSLKARKLEGAEGFIVMFRVADGWNSAWWNLGGWGNVRHAVELTVGNVKSEVSPSVTGQIETDRWYDVRIEVKGERVRCLLEGELIHDFTLSGVPGVRATVGRDAETGELILKFVNASSLDQPAQISIEGAKAIAPTGTAWVIKGEYADENSFEAPLRVAPVKSTAEGLGNDFNWTFPARSITVLKVKEGS